MSDAKLEMDGKSLKVTVWSSDKAALVTAGKLKSTDGVYGIRFAHNTDATVSGLKLVSRLIAVILCEVPTS